jgi:mono/diheme cytochrome c family protein
VARGVPRSDLIVNARGGPASSLAVEGPIPGRGMRNILWCWAAAAACVVAAPRIARAQGTAGANTFRVRCVMCHGPQGRGDGPMAASLNPRPMDFTDASKRLATTDSAVAAVIRRGRRAMPSFAQVLSASQVDSVVAFIKTLHR